ncbi:MAG: hypothetical protein AAB503_00700 [Patescibacteria group bacterium]
MKGFFLFTAVWNTVVAIINTTVLPLFCSKAVMVYVTPRSQLTPIIVSLFLFALYYEKFRRALKWVVTH